jgi:hypothetical protein
MRPTKEELEFELQSLREANEHLLEERVQSRRAESGEGHAQVEQALAEVMSKVNMLDQARQEDRAEINAEVKRIAEDAVERGLTQAGAAFREMVSRRAQELYPTPQKLLKAPESGERSIISVPAPQPTVTASQQPARRLPPASTRISQEEETALQQQIRKEQLEATEERWREELRAGAASISWASIIPPILLFLSPTILISPLSFLITIWLFGTVSGLLITAIISLLTFIVNVKVGLLLLDSMR